VSDTVIVGLGNLLLKDDGAGVHTIRALEKEILPPSVELVDGGTSTLSLLSYFVGCPKIIIIDALQAGLPPGTIYRLRPEDIPHYRSEHLSIHDVQILDVIKMAAMIGEQPEVVILGIEPQEIASGLELTPVIEERIPSLVQSVIKELYA
jgi:hydrogenase maturation protease